MKNFLIKFFRYQTIPFFLVGIFLGFVVFHFFSYKNSVLVVDAFVSKGAVFEVFVNNNTYSPIQESIRSGLRNTYVFKIKNTLLTNLRLDPTDVQGADIIIYSIQLEKNNKVLKFINPSEIKPQQLSNIEIKRKDKGEIELFSITSDPIITINSLNVLDSIFSFFEKFKNFISPFKYLNLSISVLLILLLCVSFFRKWIIPFNYLFFLFACIFLFIIGKFIFFEVLYCEKFILSDVYDAIGYAGYTGLKKQAEVYAFWSVFFFFTVSIFLLVQLWKYLERVIKG